MGEPIDYDLHKAQAARLRAEAMAAAWRRLGALLTPPRLRPPRPTFPAGGRPPLALVR